MDKSAVSRNLGLKSQKSVFLGEKRIKAELKPKGRTFPASSVAAIQERDLEAFPDGDAGKWWTEVN